MYGDIFTSSRTITEIIEMNHSIGPNNGIFATFEVKNPERYGCLQFSDNYLIEVREKDPSPPSNKINAGIMVLPITIFETLKNTTKSLRGEIELTDGVNELIKRGSHLTLYHIRDYWIDIGYPWNILEANETGMRHMTFPKTNLSLPGVNIEGNIKIAEDVTLRPGTFIQGPVIIEENAILGPNCFIRPYSFIGKNVRIGNGVEIKNSIIFDNTIIGHLSYIGDSIVGKECNFGAGTKVANLKIKEEYISMIINGKRISSGQKKLGVFMGDNVKTGINVSIMPGVTIGENSCIGAHTLVNRNIPSNSLLYQDPDKGLIQKSHKNSGTNLDE
jgi:bifunctional UDP-N-acetylglucosamine pyrophosphorylase/glucosamine-1-phosphate N-acetyltransferase